MNEQIPVLYHGTTRGNARSILRGGFRLAQDESFTGTSVNLSESMSVAYEHGEYENSRVVLKVTLSRSTLFQDLGRVQPDCGYDAWFETQHFDAARTYSGNVWLLRNLTCIEDVRVLDADEALKILTQEFEEEGPECGYNGVAGEYADIWHGRHGDWMKRFPDTKEELTDRLRKLVGRSRSPKLADEIVQSDLFAEANLAPAAKTLTIKQYDFNTQWSIAIESAFRKHDARMLYQNASSNIFNPEGGTVIDGLTARTTDFPGDVAQELDSFAASILSAMLAYARTHFSNGVKVDLAIDTDAFYIAAQYENRRSHKLSRFNPQAAWQWLENTYGGDAGVNQAYSQVAAAIASALSLERHAPVFRAGHLVLEKSMWGERGKGCTKYEWHSSSISELRKLCEHFGNFMQWHGDDKSAVAIPQVFNNSQWSSYNWDVQPRERLALCEDIQLVAFQKKVEVNLSIKVAEQFQIFISTYGPQMNLAA